MRCSEADRLIQKEGDGAASAAERARLRGHLASCAACRKARADHRALITLLAADPERRASDGFEARLFSRLAGAPARPSPGAWWRRFSFIASWRLAPALAATAALAASVAVWKVAPAPRSPGSPYVAECVQQHRILVRVQETPASTSDQEVIDYSIAQSTQGSISDTN